MDAQQAIINEDERERLVNRADALIAVAALRYTLTLLATDSDFMHVPTLLVENWVP